MSFLERKYLNFVLKRTDHGASALNSPANKDRSAAGARAWSIGVASRLWCGWASVGGVEGVESGARCDLFCSSGEKVSYRCDYSLRLVCFSFTTKIRNMWLNYSLVSFCKTSCCTVMLTLKGIKLFFPVQSTRLKSLNLFLYIKWHRLTLGSNVLILIID